LIEVIGEDRLAEAELARDWLARRFADLAAVDEDAERVAEAAARVGEHAEDVQGRHG